MKSLIKLGVFPTMEEREITKNEETINQTNLQEEYLKSLDELEEGHVVQGHVIQVTDETVFVDIGYKSEGKIPLSEFEIAPKVGDNVNVILIKKESKDGNIIVSKKKFDEKEFWKNLKKAFMEKTSVEATVSKDVKGGFEVLLGYNVKAFVPISKMDIAKVEKPEEYINNSYKFYVERLYSDKKINIVLNRKSYILEELTHKKEEFFNTAKVGDTVEATVKSIASFGAFIDLGGFDGLLHINDMSWGHVVKPKDYVKKGQKITLKIINLNKENNKINLSLKHFSENPWDTFLSRYSVGDIVKGKVTKLTDFGVFIEIEDGIEGMAHISEFSWVKKINHPKELFAIGDDAECMILNYDVEQGRISLGIKQVLENPWDSMENKYPEGMQLERKIIKVTNAGAFIELEEGISGFLHIDDISWTKKVKNAFSILKVNDMINIVILNIDKENRRIRLGVKQLSDNPWEVLSKTFLKGSVIEGKITGKTDFGLFVKVQGDIEGLINKSNISEKFNEELDEEIGQYKVGDDIKAIITEINPKKKKLALSIKEYKKNIQREEISKYMQSDNDTPMATLGDFMKQ
ncbi:MAG: S1 RNA-binding domain-containing protein [Spirochaetaceae bacterium]|nr:S1 RNA-binding domain-containing protein [Spirochaetaceae bacterium]